jgi:hypothetical protein
MTVKAKSVIDRNDLKHGYLENQGASKIASHSSLVDGDEESQNAIDLLPFCKLLYNVYKIANN